MDGDVDVDGVASAVASKRARSGGHRGFGSIEEMSDGAKLDQLFCTFPDFARIFQLVDQNSKRLDSQGFTLDDLKRKVA
eukprot:1957905-Amphidinium_carterae.1